MPRIFGLILILLLIGANGHAATCVIGAPFSINGAEVGEVLRNPGSNGVIPVEITVSCGVASRNVEMRVRDTAFVHSTNGSLRLNYTLSTIGGTLNSQVSPPASGSRLLLGTTNESGDLRITLNVHPNSTPNAQPGTYAEEITIIAGDGTADVSTRSLILSGAIADDCSVSVGAAPSPDIIGEVVQSQANDYFSIPISASCRTYQAKVSVRAQRGSLQGNVGNMSSIPYSVTLDSSFANTVTHNSNNIAGNWAFAGTMPLQQVQGNLRIQPEFIPNVPADTYRDTIYIRVNSP